MCCNYYCYSVCVSHLCVVMCLSYRLYEPYCEVQFFESGGAVDIHDAYHSESSIMWIYSMWIYSLSWLLAILDICHVLIM